MILREWRAEIRRSDRDAYAAYVRDTGLAGYGRTPGNLVVPPGTVPSAADTERANPVAGRRSVAIHVPTRAASPPPAGTTTIVNAVRANGGLLTDVTDAGAGTRRWALRLGSGGADSSRARPGIGAGSGARAAPHAEIAHTSVRAVTNCAVGIRCLSMLDGPGCRL